MHFNNPLSKIVTKIKPDIVRIVCHNSGNPQPSAGTGLIISSNNLILTCLHVAFGVSQLSQIENTLRQERIQINKDGYRHYFDSKVRVNVNLFNEIQSFPAQLIDFLYERDIAIIKIERNNLKSTSLNFDKKFNIGDDIAFCGFPITPLYNEYNYPFTCNKGIISTFADAMPNGIYRFEHIHVNAVNLGGNSGAPLFLVKNGQLIGIIDGNMLSTVTLQNIPTYNQERNILPGNITISLPLTGVGYAIPFHETMCRDFIKEVLVKNKGE